MKILLIVSGVIALAFIASQIFALIGQKDIETYPYIVNKKFDNFEVRTYEASLFTSVKLTTKSYKEGSSKGFSILAGYIFGGNNANEKISMTSPVTMSLDDSMTMMFMVPKKYSKSSLPEPNQANIKFREEPSKTMAAITFGGWSNDEKIKINKQKLINALSANGIPFTNNFYFFGYNPPFEVFIRRNEVVVELPEGALEEIKNL